jgi:hypothetical protein
MAKARIVSDAGHPIILRGNREEPEEREKSLPTGSIPQKKKEREKRKEITLVVLPHVTLLSLNER